VGYYYRSPVDEHGRQSVIPLGPHLLAAGPSLQGNRSRAMCPCSALYEREARRRKPRTQFDDKQRLKPQILAWLVRERWDIPEQLEWREQVGELIKPLAATLG
jgi:hypothetical protein